MVSNKKVQMYEKNILGSLGYGLSTLRTQGDFRNLRNKLGKNLTDEDLLVGSNLDSTKLYKQVSNMDKSGNLKSQFISDVIERVQDAHNHYQHEHRVEVFVPEKPFYFEKGLVFDKLYSTHGSRSLNIDPKVQELLEHRAIFTIGSWEAELYGAIANQYGSFYGVSYTQAKNFVGVNGGANKGTLDDDLISMSVISVDKLKRTKIISPNNINIDIFINPSANKMTPEIQIESRLNMGFSKDEAINSFKWI
jgi:hypothetical protein